MWGVVRNGWGVGADSTVGMVEAEYSARVAVSAARLGGKDELRAYLSTRSAPGGLVTGPNRGTQWC